MEIHQIMLNTKCKKKRGGEKLTSAIKTDPLIFCHVIQFIIFVIFITIISVIIFILIMVFSKDNVECLQFQIEENVSLHCCDFPSIWFPDCSESFSDLLFHLSPFRLRRLRMPPSQISAFLISQIPHSLILENLIKVEGKV